MCAYSELCLFRTNFINNKNPNKDFTERDDPNLLIYSSRLFWEADIRIAGHDISRILWNIYIPRNIHNSPPMVHVPTQMNPAQNLLV
jgi:hypothetical protein